MKHPSEQHSCSHLVNMREEFFSFLPWPALSRAVMDKPELPESRAV